MAQLALVFLGSGLGGVLRVVLGAAVQRAAGSDFPFGTLAVNVSGCLVMGFLATAWSQGPAAREEWRLAILVGLLGGYTTFSSFSRETLDMAQAGEWLRASAYVLASTGLSLAATWVGAAAARLHGAAAP